VNLRAPLLSCTLLLSGLPAANAGSSRASSHSNAWKGVAVIGGAHEFATLLLSRELPIDHFERADLAIQTADFLRENQGRIEVQWNDSERRLRLVASGKESVPFEATARSVEVEALSGRLLGKSRTEAEAALREYFDQTAGAAASTPLDVRQRPGDSFRPLRRRILDRSEAEIATAPPAPHPIRAFAPHFVTGLNLASGLGALLYAAHGAVLPAAGLILLANVFDALDGRVARWLGAASPMGTELDSLADVVSFGAAPALLVHQAALTALGWPGAALAGAFAFAGAFRLARFNLQALGVTASGKTSDSFTGMPIPAGAGVIVSLALALPLLPAAAAPWVAAGVTALAALAMVSRIPYPAFKKGGIKTLAIPSGLSIAAALLLLWLGLPALIPAAVFGGYLLSGPIRAATKR